MGIDLDEASREIIAAWAAANDCVREIWLFGSRARGDSSPGSDVDIAIILMPTSWALGAYFAKGDDWQRELGGLLNRDVSLEAIAPDHEGYDTVMREGCRLWSRG
jgi:predicted nucleotidyltransferase